MPPQARAIRWTEHAVTQLATIAEYINLSSPIYAEQVVAQVEHDSSRRVFSRNRDAWCLSSHSPEIRELIEWPHRLIYRVRPKVIEVLSVLHGRQDLRSLP